MKYILIILALLLECQKEEYNLLRIGCANLNYKNKNAKKLTDDLIKTDFDIFIGIEWTGENLEKSLFESLNYKLILDSPKNGTHGFCIIAKEKLKIEADIIKAPVKGPCAIPICIARFYYCDKIISVFGIHSPPPIKVCNNTTNKTNIQISNWIEDGKLIKDIGIAKKGDYVILAGDFNARSNSKGIRFIKSKGMIDSFKKFNLFAGTTWSPKPWLPSLIRIDYIFYSKNIDVLDAKRFKIIGSDHKGLYIDI